MSKNTLYKLQRPTLALISSLYQIPSDIQNLFIDMMTIYEQNPTIETGKALFDKVMGDETPEAKKEWFYQKAQSIPQEIREKAEKKYILEQQSVPKGLPTSDNLMVGLEVINRSDKNALMNAQAAARIFDNLEHPEQINLTKELLHKNSNGVVSEARAYLNKPFSTQIQKLEHLSALLAGWHKKQNTKHPKIELAYRELLKAAILTFYQVADNLSENSASVATEIRDLALSYAPKKAVENWDFTPIKELFDEISTDFEALFTEPKEKELVKELIIKRMNQIQSNFSPMQKYPTLGRPQG